MGSAIETGQAGSEDDVLADAAASQFHDQILDEASTGHDGGAEGSRERAHVRTAAPSVVWSHEFQTDFVFEDMGRRIDLDVQRTPQRRSHRSIVWCHQVLVMHDVFSLR